MPAFHKTTIRAILDVRDDKPTTALAAGRRTMRKRILTTKKNLSLEHTFNCGQCFRWKRQDDGSYVGIAYEKVARLYEEGQNVILEAEGDISFWRNYFDLYRDYDAIFPLFGTHPFTLAALEYGKGLRVLKQARWETICTFILSQRNNIPRITGLVDRLCKLYGDNLEFDGKTYAGFPDAISVLRLDNEGLEYIKAGYRGKYILGAAFAIVDRVIDVEELYNMTTLEARKKLMELNGVGPKVADCILLFGFDKTDAFPVDTWMKKAAKYYDGNLDAETFKEHAGIAQQYIFHYVRHLERKS